MSDSYSDPQQNGRNFDGNRGDGSRGGFRGNRGQGNRDSGGFRIRLSDNEMRAARSLQEAFNLRSTVAVLGFALRTLGQMLEEGKLDEQVAQHRAQGPRGNNRRDDSKGTARGRFNGESRGGQRDPKPNPFARPQKPQPTEAQIATETSKDSNELSEEITTSENIEQGSVEEPINQNPSSEIEDEKASTSSDEN